MNKICYNDNLTYTKTFSKGFCISQIIIITNFVIVWNVGMKRIDHIQQRACTEGVFDENI